MRSIIKVDSRDSLVQILGMALVVGALITAGTAWPAIAKAPERTVVNKVFPSPEAAVEALVEALKSNDEKALLAIFGKEGRDLLTSGDETADRRARTRFLELYQSKHQLSQESDRMMALELGEERWPFPIPLVKHGEQWCFDTPLGKEEILNRRIGRNEMDTIQVCLAFVDAQREYAAKDRDGDGVLEYAQQVVSSEGKQDGLFWPPEEGREPSPLGPLFARAQEEGYGRKTGNRHPTPYHGYYYKILKAQGRNAPGGARDYVVKDNMIGGFALVAYPARYGSSGIMTFMVSHDGVVYEKNLGSRTKAVASSMQRFDPDRTWKKVPQ